MALPIAIREGAVGAEGGSEARRAAVGVAGRAQRGSVKAQTGEPAAVSATASDGAAAGGIAVWVSEGLRLKISDCS